LEGNVLIANIVRETLGLKDHRVVSVERAGLGLTVAIDRKRGWRAPCSRCGLRGRVRDRLQARVWQHVPLWGMPVVLVYRPRRVRCETCGVVVEAIPWAQGKSPLTAGLVVVLATWTRLLAWEVVAGLFGVSWSTVQAAVRRAVAFGLAQRDTSSVLYIGLDEISRQRGYVYHTQVYDLGQKRLLWSGEGRREDTLRRFFAEWGAERIARVRGICCDMWHPYLEVIREAAPQATIVFDRFHLVRHLLNAVNAVRKAEARELRKSNPALLQGTRYLWLKNPWNLTEQQQQRLSVLERLNLKVNRAYLLKEAFRRLWAYRRRGWAKRYLRQWFWWATHSRLKPLRDFAWLLRRHEDGVLAWFDVPITNGATEAMNNNAKAVSHRAHGYRTAAAFTLSLLHCLGQLTLPETLHRFV
jgi:transposase